MRPGAEGHEALPLAKLVRRDVPNDLERRAECAELALVDAPREDAVALHATHHVLHTVARALVGVVEAPLPR